MTLCLYRGGVGVVGVGGGAVKVKFGTLLGIRLLDIDQGERLALIVIPHLTIHRFQQESTCTPAYPTLRITATEKLVAAEYFLS